MSVITILLVLRHLIIDNTVTHIHSTSLLPLVKYHSIVIITHFAEIYFYQL